MANALCKKEVPYFVKGYYGGSVCEEDQIMESGFSEDGAVESVNSRIEIVFYAARMYFEAEKIGNPEYLVKCENILESLFEGYDLFNRMVIMSDARTSIEEELGR